MTATETNPPIAIVAGGGALPGEVVGAVTRAGRPVVLIAIRGEADPGIEAFNPHWLEWGQIGRFFDILKANGCKELVLIGSISKRPDFKAVAPDFGTIKRLPRIIAALVGGDDSILKRVIGIIEQEGVSIVAPQDVAPELLVPDGKLTKTGPDDLAKDDIRLGFDVVRTLGTFDVGQAAIVAGGRVVAIEAAEGTDRMLRRCADLHETGRLSWRGKRGVLVKRTKPGQELRTDLPTIGPDTVSLCAAAHLAGIAVEANGVLVAKRSETIAVADKAGLFIMGVPGAKVT